MFHLVVVFVNLQSNVQQEGGLVMILSISCVSLFKLRMLEESLRVRAVNTVNMSRAKILMFRLL